MSPKLLLEVIAILLAVVSLFTHGAVLLPAAVILCAVGVLVP